MISFLQVAIRTLREATLFGWGTTQSVDGKPSDELSGVEPYDTKHHIPKTQDGFTLFGNDAKVSVNGTNVRPRMSEWNIAIPAANVGLNSMTLVLKSSTLQVLRMYG